MGVLDKLMFWKKDTVELEYEVDGCFTLPIDEAEGVAEPDLEPIAGTATTDDATEQC